MKSWAVLGLALISYSVQSALEVALGLGPRSVDVTALLLVFTALHMEMVVGVLTAFALGYLQDVLSGRPAGLFPLAAILVFLAIRAVATWVDGRARGSFSGLTLGACLGHGLLLWALAWIKAPPEVAPWTSFSALALQCAWNAMVAALAWPWVQRWSQSRLSQEAWEVRL